jgi:hypothetical protein
MAVVPIGSKVEDRSQAFAEVFCATLPHTDHGKWGACGQYLAAQVTRPPEVPATLSTNLKVMVVGGAFSECFETKQLHVFQDGIEHLENAHGVDVGPPVPTGGTATPEANAIVIAEHLRNNPGDYVAVGHSKGAVDLMTAIQLHDIARQRIKAVVSVAGAIGGTRLADLGVTLGIFGFKDAVRRAGLGRCKIVDHGGISSLRRETRYQALRDWRPPASLRSYSLVAVSSHDRTSAPLHTMWERLEVYSRDQDSHIVAEEAVIPGSEYLGIAKADHWAVALPMSEHHLTKKRVDHNAYPRRALLEALVRYVVARAP